MKRMFSVFLLITVWLLVTPFLQAQSHVDKVLKDEITSDLKENILSFWERYSVDSSGGFYGSLGRDGAPIADAPKGGVLNARILWTFSTAYRMYGDTAYRKLADRAQRYFIDHFIDSQYGGVYWLIKADGTPLDTNKQTYGCSYAIYGLSEHFRATGNNESLQKAIELYRIMESKVKDPVNDGYIESFTREWGTPQKLGYDGDGIAAKTMNTHIHVLEAYTALYKVWKDNSLCKRLAKVIDLITTRLYNPQTHHLISYYICLQYRICMLFSFLSEIHSKKMVYPLPFCTSGIRFSVYAKYMYFKDELYIRIATFEINNRNNDDLRYCYIYLYSHQADNCHSKRTHHLEKKIQRINI